MHFVIRTDRGLRGGTSVHRPGTGHRWQFRRPFLDLGITRRHYDLLTESHQVVGGGEIIDTLKFAVRHPQAEEPINFDRYNLGGSLRFPNGNRLEIREEASGEYGRLRFTFIQNRVGIGRLRQTKTGVWHLVLDQASESELMISVGCALIESLRVADA